MTLQELLSRLNGVKKSGAYHTAKCPAHDDKENSLSVKEQPGGKLTVECYAGCTIQEVMGALDLKVSDLYPEERRTRGRGRAHSDIVATYDYTDSDGKLLYQVVRFAPKKFRPRRPDPDKPGEWLWNTQGVTPVLYNLQAIEDAVALGKKVFICEGEKDVDSLRRLGLRATTNAFGAKKWDKRFNTLLNETTCIILPDNDEPGRERAAMLHGQLKDSVILELPGLPEKGDVSDWIAAGGTRDALTSLVRRALKDRDAAPVVPEPEPPQAKGVKAPYRVLGHNGGRFYFLSPRSQQVVTMTKSDLRNKVAFFELAPLQYWETTYEGDFTAAADALVSRAIKAGIWRPEHRRGRGAWMDDKRVVLHQGGHLVVDGKRVELGELETGYVYEQAPPLSIPHKAPLTADQGQRLVDLCNMLKWEQPVLGQLLAGWIALAPICGALQWRPHIWITGPAGSGKTWVAEQIVGGVLRDVVLSVQSVTTEAGLRQVLGHDARPVQFDEAEQDDERCQANMRRVLELARQASSEGGAIIAKGTVSGQAMTFAIRSAFCLTSIAVALVRRADETRVTVLCLKATHDSEHFQRLKDLQQKVCTDDFSAALVARSCTMAGVIRANAETFAVAVSEALNSRRLGDQLGTLLAGYWSLWSDGLVELEEAVRYVAGLDLTHLVPQEGGTDEDRCLQRMLETRVSVQADRNRLERTVGELVECVADGNGDLPQSLAHDALKRYGLRVDDEGLLVSNTHSGVAELLRSTPWATNWHLFLKRLPGARAYEKNVRFAGGGPTRCILVPSHVVRGEHIPEPGASRACGDSGKCPVGPDGESVGRYEAGDDEDLF